MKKNKTLIAGVLITFVSIIAIVGFIKFNFTDVPYSGNPVVYTSRSGERIKTHYKTDSSVEVHFLEYDSMYQKAFTAQQVQSASGAKYKSKDSKFVFWNKGESVSIYNDKDELIFQGEENPNKPKEEWFAGKLVFGHESQTFQKCGEQEIVWVSDPENLIREKYDVLTKNKQPHTAVYAELIGVITPVGANEDGFAPDFKRRLTVADITMEPLEKYPSCNIQQGEETIYYSEVFKKWRDQHGDCNTCTPENGFSKDGSIEKIVWRELWLTLNNDANEYPTIEELKTFFKEHYAEKSDYYPVHVNRLKQEGGFSVIIPVPKELKNIDFFAPNGALLATYDVIEHHWNDNGTVTFVRYPKKTVVDNQKKARNYVEQTEIYVQDGHNLRLRQPQLYKCSSCFDFVFDHYGDPDVPYYISVRVNGDGTFDEIKTRRED